MWQLSYSNEKMSIQAFAQDKLEFMTWTCSVSLGKTDSHFIAENSYLIYSLRYHYHGLNATIKEKYKCWQSLKSL